MCRELHSASFAMHSPLGFASETPRARSALVWAKREVVDNGAKPRSVWAGRTEVWTSAACRSPAIRGEAKGRRAAGDPNLKLETPHGSDSSADSGPETKAAAPAAVLTELPGVKVIGLAAA